MSHLVSSDIRQFLTEQSSTAQWPKLNSIECDDTTAQLELEIDDQLEYFDGHFPDQAVLPGVVQVHWAGELSQRIFALTGFHTLQGAKFNSMVLPNSTVRLSLRFKPDNNSVSFEFSNDDVKFSAGRLLFNTSSEVDI